MDTLGSWLQTKNMPQQAIDRHQAARDQVTAQYMALMSDYDALLNATSEEDQDAALQALEAKLQDQRFKRPNAPFDPNKLPVNTPDSDTRVPADDSSQLLSYLGINPYDGYTQVAATQMDPQLWEDAFTTPNGPTAADLEHTAESPLTDDIANLAAELNHNPVDIYTWVHKNIRFIPSYGSIQGAQMTLETRRGNATDTASLTIALLRASGIPARYAYGSVNIPVDKIMNWVGGVETPQAAGNLMGQGGIPNVLVHIDNVPAHFRIEHTWVEAYVDFEPSRGVKNNHGDHWIPMDASFKQYDFTEGYDLQAEVPFDAQALINDIEATATVNETEGWVQNIPQQSIEAQLETYQQQLEDYIANQNPDATVGEVLGLNEIKILPPQPLSAGLPYALHTRTQHFATVPESIKHRFEYTLSTENLGSQGARLITINKPTVEIAGKGMSVSFRPSSQEDEDIIAGYIPDPDPETGEIDPSQLLSTLPGYLINLTAEFTIEGELQDSAGAGTMGETLYETLGVYSPSKGWRRSTNFSIAGEYRAIAVDLQGSSPEQAARLQSDVEQTKSILESGDDLQVQTLTKHQVVGQLLEGTIFSYFALNNVQDQSASVTTYRAPSYGLFRTNIDTSYWFGLPRDTIFSGLVMDVDLVTHQTVDNSNDTNRWIQFNQSIGSRYSAMEHLVPEQMFSVDENPAEGISAVKALSIASTEGQKVYTIDNSNLSIALAAIQLGDETETEIRNAVLAGNVVTTHRYQINFNGWIGEGYIILDPDTGSGAYMIGGGQNGGYLDVFHDVFSYLALALGTGAGALQALFQLLDKSPIFGVIARQLGILSIAESVYHAVISGCHFTAILPIIMIGILVTILPFALGALALGPFAPIIIFAIATIIERIFSVLVSAIVENCDPNRGAFRSVPNRSLGRIYA